MADLRKPQRLLELLELLQSGRSYNARQLASHCKVTRRTIFRDLATLQEAGFHAHYSPEQQTYSLPHQTFLPPTGFTVDEVLALLVVCQNVGGGTGIPFQLAAHTAATKLANMLPASLRRDVGQVAETISIRMAPHNTLTHVQNWYRLLTRALQLRRAVRIEYASVAEQTTISTKLGPYELFFSRRSWYVIGRSSLHRAVRTFNLSRIQQALLLEDTYVRPPRFSLDRQLGKAWHMIRGKPRARVQVHFTKLVAANVAEVRWHRTEAHTWNPDGSLIYTVTVDGFDEIVWWLLSYGDQAEVLEPAELRARLAGHAKRMLAQHRKRRP